MLKRPLVLLIAGICLLVVIVGIIGYVCSRGSGRRSVGGRRVVFSSVPAPAPSPVIVSSGHSARPVTKVQPVAINRQVGASVVGGSVRTAHAHSSVTSRANVSI
ncbi:hypothetical protein NECID01_0696 [Nematocida sp. AWRm77]|nr:hypothetical protein NECID01_0696 [Nematocida sp. AWRm77]